MSPVVACRNVGEYRTTVYKLRYNGSMTKCSVDECERPVRSRGLCNAHYLKLRRAGLGDPLYHRVEGDPVARFHQKYEVADNGCWLWVDRSITRGYALLYVGSEGKHQVRAHRWSYEHFKGPIPDGLQIDHVCHNRDEPCAGGITCLHRRCVNPDHLEAVDGPTNLSRTKNFYGNLTHCKYGHEFTPENTAVRGGARFCRACRKRNNKEASLLRAERNRAARG